ncbi:MAG: hypothetical protein NG747_02445 [Candidatus Brocadia sp.]|nr:hypothetical protein [Candidatus Brocadia sp.]
MTKIIKTYIASILENKGHEVEKIPFNSELDIVEAIRRMIAFHRGIEGIAITVKAWPDSITYGSFPGCRTTRIYPEAIQLPGV